MLLLLRPAAVSVRNLACFLGCVGFKNVFYFALVFFHNNIHEPFKISGLK